MENNVIQVGDDIIFFSPTRKAGKLFRWGCCWTTRGGIFIFIQEEVSLAFIIPSSLWLLIIAIINDSLPHFFISLRSVGMANLTLSPVSLCRLDRTFRRRKIICIFWLFYSEAVLFCPLCTWLLLSLLHRHRINNIWSTLHPPWHDHRHGMIGAQDHSSPHLPLHPSIHDDEISTSTFTIHPRNI